MIKNPARTLSLCLLLLCASAHSDGLIQAVSDSARPAAEKARDEYRNPQQTLRFFDVQADMTVVEISPGGGWYSNILAPYLKDKGTYYAAHFHIDENSHDYYKKALQRYKDKIANNPGYKKVKLTSFDPVHAFDIAPETSADRVLTFRNVHNWFMRHGDEGVDNAFTSFFKALKKGGMLGVVEHRLPESADDALQRSSGYMKQSYVIAAAEKAGFKLVGQSEVNANPLDTADHANGVWTLPPVMRGQTDTPEDYLAIGESDRMTLKFIKP